MKCFLQNLQLIMSAKKQLTLKRKLEIIEDLSQDNPPSKRCVSRKYEVSDFTIRSIWKNKDTIKRQAALLTNDLQDTLSKLPQAKYSDLEEKLLEWIEVIRTANLPVSPSLIVAKAKELAVTMSYDDFKGSWGWYRRFKRRRGLQHIVLHGEGGEVDKTDPKTLSELKVLYDEISKYEPDCIYNMDETGLFFRILPKYSVLLPDEDAATTRGRKKAKERLTLVVCANATGTHKIPLCMIGKPKIPTCIKGRKWPLKYMDQRRAWMDRFTCSKWFDEVFLPEIKKRTGRPVLLIMDNAPGHFTTIQKQNVTIKFLPANVTSWKQPCDLGIISALKCRYKFMHLKRVLDFYQLDADVRQSLKEQGARKPRGSAGIDHGKPATLLDAANIATKAWDLITATTIKNSFQKADLHQRSS